MARRDATRHWARTVLATTLVALPMAALVGGTVLTQSNPPARDTALASIPDGVQAVITTTAVARHEEPFPQLPEGAPGPWVDDLGQVPASGAELAERLPAGNRLLRYWDSPSLVATSGLDLAPGEQTSAGAGVDTIEDLDLSLVSATTLREAGPEALALLVPELASGDLPADETETVITTDLAGRLGVTVGDPVAWVAPPHTGWHGTEGRVGEVIQDTQRSYQVSGLVESGEPKAWAREGWLSEQVAADPAGVPGQWLMVGDQPVSWDHVRQINVLQAFAVSRDVLEHYPSRDELYPVTVDRMVLVNRAAAIIMASAVGALLVLFLVTPAFSVSTEQSRRTLGLAAATGAAPPDLRRIITAQGLVVGLAGGLLGATIGAVAGLLARRVLSPEAATQFPWWILPVTVGIAALLGVFATLLPAQAAARLAPVDAIKDRAPGTANPNIRRRRDFAGPLLLVAAAGCAVLSLSLPTGLAAAAGGALLLLLLALLAAVIGLVLSVRPLIRLAATLAPYLAAAPRLALRDALDHRTRFLPAATGVLAAVCAASFLAVLVGSGVANQRDRYGEMAAGARIVLGLEVPVSPDFDRMVLADTIDMLAEELPVTGHEPVFAVPVGSDVQLSRLAPPDRACPEGRFPDTASSVAVGAPLQCVDWEQAYTPGLAVPWLIGGDVHILTGDAMRASGLPGADEAAAVLDRGGAVVNSAAMLADDGTVRVATAAEPLATEADADRTATLPGAFVRGFAPPLAVSPETARTLGVTDLEYVGEYVMTSAELSHGDLAQARDRIQAHSTLVSMYRPQLPYPWGGSGMLLLIALVAGLAVAATTISLLLARTQAVQDVATMHAVGATPRFLRRFTLVQAAVVLAAGVPLGALAGIALGAYQVAWNRRAGFEGAWLVTVPLWGVQAGIVVGVVVAGVATALVVARAPRRLVRRTID